MEATHASSVFSSRFSRPSLIVMAAPPSFTMSATGILHRKSWSTRESWATLWAVSRARFGGIAQTSTRRIRCPAPLDLSTEGRITSDNSAYFHAEPSQHDDKRGGRGRGDGRRPREGRARERSRERARERTRAQKASRRRRRRRRVDIDIAAIGVHVVVSDVSRDARDRELRRGRDARADADARRARRARAQRVLHRGRPARVVLRGRRGEEDAEPRDAVEGAQRQGDREVRGEVHRHVHARRRRRPWIRTPEREESPGRVQGGVPEPRVLPQRVHGDLRADVQARG
eukprot:31032-Pelagococcus_subviridis.AAC.7